MNVLRRFDSLLIKAEVALLLLLLSAMVILAFLQVVLRNAFAEGIIWADILLRHMVLWVGFLGAAVATSRDRHINIDALTRFLPERAKSFARILTNAFAALICLVLTLASVDFIRNEIELGSTVYADLPSWYAQLIIPVGYLLLSIHFAVRTLLAMFSRPAPEAA
jgi:TRAP-type C4-dicarboxylate transport system permease small subunit